MRADNKQTITFTFTIEKSLLNKIKKKANTDLRSLSYTINEILRKELK